MIDDWARDAIADWGYLGLALLILVENLFPPIPSEVILPLAGYYVATGQLAFAQAVAAATVGSTTGALVLYTLARWGGQPLLLRMAPLLRLSERDVMREEARFRRHGWKIVLFGRMLPGVRSLVSIPAGLSGMPVTRFTLLTAIGATAWNTMLIGAGWLLRDQYARVAVVIEPLSKVLFAVAVAGAVAWLVRLYKRRRGAAAGMGE